MSDKIKISATEVGVVRVFAVDIPADQIATFTARNGSWPLSEALGADTLDPEHAVVFDAADLADMGLPGYLHEGHAIPADQIEQMRPKLMAQDGTVMVITSRAFGGASQTLDIRAPLRLIATFSEAHDPITFGALPDASARTPEHEDKPQGKAPSDAAMSGRVATVVLLALALLVIVMVWIAS